MQPELIIAPAAFFMVGFIIWTTVTAWQRRQRMRLLMDFNTRLIDRLGSINDFSEFARTEAGANFLKSVMTDPPLVRPGERILRATQTGIVLMTLGLGLLSLAWYFDPDFAVVGVIALSLGTGFLLASAASYRISSSMGLLPMQLQTSK